MPYFKSHEIIKKSIVKQNILYLKKESIICNHSWNEICSSGTGIPSQKFTPHVTKNKPTRIGMILSNNNNYVSKCYLKFFKIVLAKIGSV
jgi:hypothetical protein